MFVELVYRIVPKNGVRHKFRDLSDGWRSGGKSPVGTHLLACRLGGADEWLI